MRHLHVLELLAIYWFSLFRQSLPIVNQIYGFDLSLNQFESTKWSSNISHCKPTTTTTATATATATATNTATNTATATATAAAAAVATAAATATTTTTATTYTTATSTSTYATTTSTYATTTSTCTTHDLLLFTISSVATYFELDLWT